MASVYAEALQKSAADLSSADALAEYLSQTPFSCSTLAPLSGGVSNFTYRGSLSWPLSSGETTVIVKHTEPYVALNKSYIFDTIRSYFEQAALTGLKDLSPKSYNNVLVTTPILHQFLSDSSTQIIQDFPDSIDLKTYLLAHNISESHAEVLGAALGSWTRSFHAWGASTESAKLRDTIRQNSNAVNLKFNVNAGRLVQTVDMFPDILGDSRDMLTEIASKLKSRRNHPDLSLIHGDFWTGNILLRSSPTCDANPAPQGDSLELLIIDWELSHLSFPSYDLGQCFAELYLPKQFRNIDAGILMISAFLNTYGHVPLIDALDTALHFGIHLTVWNRIWGNQEQVEECVKVGREYIRNAWQGNQEWFRGGPLHKLFF